MGSPGYMPPEQASGTRGQMSRRSDVYSLGAMLYHLLTGRPPFGGGSVAETLRQVETQEPVSLQLLNPAVPIDLETMCFKCLEKEPARRYDTARDLAEELGRYLNDETIRARPIGKPEKLWRWCRRKPGNSVRRTRRLSQGGDSRSQRPLPGYGTVGKNQDAWNSGRGVEFPGQARPG
jgi:serine/threonine-protein kinase